MAKQTISSHSRIFKDLTGQRFGKLLVLSRAENRVFRDGSTKVCWLCVCDCGEQTTVLAGNMTRGKTSSCGCGSEESRRGRMTTHGASGTPEYGIWAAMIHRCGNPSYIEYHLYGGRGIRVCAEWRHDFAAFFAHIGPRPSPKHSIDRIDVNGNYEPGNVRWATPREQILNRRQRTHCKHGHEFTPENTYLRKGGGRTCRRCMRLYPSTTYAKEPITP